MGKVKEIYMDMCSEAYSSGYYAGMNGMPRAWRYYSQHDDARNAYIDGYCEGQYDRIKGEQHA
jgi:ribosome modulation factor